MIRREKLHALILSRRNVGEADRLLTCLTREYGLLRVRANGVRKIPSRRGGHVEPFSHVLGIISGAPERLYLAAVETVTEHEGLRSDPVSLGYAEPLSRLICSLLPEAAPEPEIFDALYQAWQILPELAEPKKQILEVAVSMCVLIAAGVVPQVASCQVCGIRQPSEAVIMDGQNGGWRCLSCHHSFSGSYASLSPRSLKIWRFVFNYPHRALQLRLNLDDSIQVLTAMRYYIKQLHQQPMATSNFTSNNQYGLLASS